MAPARLSSLRQTAAIEWLYLAIGLVLVWSYRWLFDDSFIYYRYVDNLLFLSAGLTYNAGEFVEGYTSPLHCLVLIALRGLRFDYPAISLGMGWVLFSAFWLLLVRLNRALTTDPTSTASTTRPVLNFPLAFLATNYSLTSFFTAGNEGALVHVVAAATALFLVRPRSRWLAAVVALSPLARPELALSLAITILFVTWQRRRLPLSLLVFSGVFNAGWLFFRIYYYADLLPNTYYLKHGSNFEAGLRYLADTTGPYHVGAILVAFGCLAVLLAARYARGGDDPVTRLQLAPRAAMLVAALSITAYVVRTGGSAMHYYYLAAPLTLALCSLGGLLEAGAAALSQRVGPAKADLTAVALMVGLTLLLLSWYPPNLSRHPLLGRAPMREKSSPTVITDPEFWRARERTDAIEWPAISEMLDFTPRLRARGYREWTTTGWCHVIYARFNERSIHAYGLTSGMLARVDLPEWQRGHKPGLRELANDVAALQRRAEAVDRGMYRAAVEAGRAPAWVARNLATIELIERKIYNRHDLLENFGLALQFPGKIVP